MKWVVSVSSWFGFLAAVSISSGAMVHASERSACDFSIRFSPSGTISDSLPRPALRKIQACADELKTVGGGSYVSYRSTRMGAAAMLVVSEITARGGQAYPIPQDFCPANRVCVYRAQAY